MATVTVQNAPDDTIRAAAEIFDKLCRSVGEDDVVVAVHHGKLAYVTVGERFYFHANGDFYEVVDVGGAL